LQKNMETFADCPRLIPRSRCYSLLFVHGFLLALLPCCGIASPQEGIAGGGAILCESPNSIAPEQTGQIKHIVDTYQKKVSETQLMQTGEEPYTFHPTAGTLFADTYIGNYVDLDPTSGLLDWGCDEWTYDGHTAHDTEIRSFGEQAIGVPIFAIQDGTVIDSHDGEYDMNITWDNQPANYVIIDHGNGRICYYWHMKKDSVAVSPGQQVSAGQQIGLVGSSGISASPHLHFATYQDGNVVEPQTGYCHPGESLWVNQIPKRVDTYVFDFGISGVDLSGYTWASELPRINQVTGTDTFYPWVLLNNLPVNSTWRIKIFKPGNVKWGEWNGSFNNSSEYRRSWWYFLFSFSSITDYGSWRFVLYVNGIKILDAPFEVVSSYSPTFNRPPEPFTISFEPASLSADDVIVCRVNTDVVFDDMDYDIVRYEYVWKVNGTQVRAVTTAAYSDAVPRQITVAGDSVTCTVTAGDGKESGPSEQISCIVRQTDCRYRLSGDLDGNCRIDLTDFSIMSLNWLMNCYGNPPNPDCMPL
jgi:hypothetical protein